MPLLAVERDDIQAPMLPQVQTYKQKREAEVRNQSGLPPIPAPAALPALYPYGQKVSVSEVRKGQVAAVAAGAEVTLRGLKPYTQYQARYECIIFVLP